MAKPTQMKKQTTASIFVLIEAWNTSINQILTNMSQATEQQMPGLQTKLKEVLKEALTSTQEALLLANSGKDSLFKVDPVGYTKATTIWSSESNIANNKHSALVDIYLRELLDEQNAQAVANGAPVAQEQILNAQADALDDTKSTVTLTSANGESSLIIDKETGDTTVLEKQPDGSMKQVGFFKRHWENVKEIAKNIWNWIAQKWAGFKDWIKGLFSNPDDQDVIKKNVTT